MKPSKRVIGAESIDHQISADGIKGLHQDNVEKIRNARRPKTKKEVKAFLGLTGYYREFIPNYAAKAVPLSDLLRKGQPNKIEWGEAQESIHHAQERANEFTYPPPPRRDETICPANRRF